MDLLTSLEKKIVLGSFIALSLLLIIGVASFVSIQRLVSSAEEVRKLQASVEILEATLSDMKDVETAMGGFLLTGEKDFLELYQGALRKVDRDLQTLPKALSAPINHQAHLPRLDTLIHAKLILSQGLIQKQNTLQSIHAAQVGTFREGKKIMDHIRREISLMQAQERRLLSLQQGQNRQIVSFTTAIILGGSLLGIVSVGLTVGLIRGDMIKRRLSQTKLQRSEALLKDAQKLAKLGSWEYEVETDALTVSDSLLTLFEVKQGREGLKNAKQFYDCVHPQDIQRLQRASEACIASGEGFQIEYKLLLADGKQKVISSYVSPFKEADGKVRKVQGTCQDITQRKAAIEAVAKSELRFRSIFRLNPFATAITRVSDGKILDANEQALQLFGYSYAEIQQVTTLQLNIWRDEKEREALIERLLEEKTLREFETSFQNKQGEVWPASNWLTIIELDGEACILWIIENISERKRLQQTLQENAQALEKANESKDKFFSIIAHDLLSPLNAMLGSAHLLSSHTQVLTQEDIEKLSLGVYASSTHMKRVLTNLLEWARMQTGGMEFNAQLVDLAAVAEQVVALLKEAAQKKDLLVENTLQEPLRLQADEQMLHLILRNLLANAIKFSTQGGSIRLDCQLLPTQVQVSIRDRGVGMSRQVQERLFKLGYKQTMTGTGGEKGTGLGLVLCKEFIEKHGGSIWVESEEGKGTSFYFTLPRS